MCSKNKTIRSSDMKSGRLYGLVYGKVMELVDKN